jgi:hypothetical protein
LETVAAKRFADLLNLREELGAGYVAELFTVDFAEDGARGGAVELGEEVLQEIGHQSSGVGRWVL